MHYACQSGNDSLVSMLLALDADIEAECHQNTRPLHRAGSTIHIHLSTHPINKYTLYQSPLSTHPINIPYQHILSTRRYLSQLNNSICRSRYILLFINIIILTIILINLLLLLKYYLYCHHYHERSQYSLFCQDQMCVPVAGSKL